jgi:hypothetical protein
VARAIHDASEKRELPLPSTARGLTSPFAGATPKALQNFHEFAALVALVQKRPPPSTKESPFSEQTEIELRKILKASNRTDHLPTLRTLVAADMRYFKNLMGTWRAEALPRWTEEQDAIRKALESSEVLSQSLSDLSPVLARLVGYALDPGTVEQLRWRDELVGQLAAIRGALGPHLQETSGDLVESGRPLHFKRLLVAGVIAKAIIEAGGKPTTTRTGPLVQALTYCIAAEHEGDLAAYDRAQSKAENVARVFLPIWKLDRSLRDFAQQMLPSLLSNSGPAAPTP